MAELQQENSQLSKQLADANGSSQALSDKQNETASQLSTAQQELLLAQNELHLPAEQLKEAKEENTKLHQLTTHIQTNLEHYQNGSVDPHQDKITGNWPKWAQGNQ